MPEIPITSPFGYVGSFVTLIGVFLILTGLGIIKIEKITVQAGKTTWMLGLFLALGGLAFLFVDFLVPPTYSTSLTPTAVPEVILLQTIDFDYQDSPINHGWEIVDASDESLVEIEHISDSFVGKAIRVHSSTWYGMDFDIGQPYQMGDIIELTVDFEDWASIYVLVSLVHQTKPASTGWIKFSPGKLDPHIVDIGNTGQGEWEVFIQPLEKVGGEWFLYQVDLAQAVEDTFGRDGWTYLQLEKVRIRGNLALDRISIATSNP